VGLQDARYHRAMAKDVILVTGGTGNIGAAVVARLAADVRAPTVRVASRDHRSKGAAVVRSLNPETVTPVPFDVDHPETMRAALEGVTKLVVIAPFVPDMAAWHEKVASAARAAGTIQLVVKSSVTGARAPTSDPPPGAVPLGHWKGEEAFRSWCPTVAIRPNIFMQHFLTTPGLYTSRADHFYLPTGQAKVSWLDARDIGLAAAELVLASPEVRAPFEGNGFELTGPTAPTAAEMAAVLSLVTRRTMTHVDGVEAFVARCKELGVSDIGKHFYGEAAGGWFAKIDDELFVKLLGRHATPFTKFVMDHAAYFGAAGGD
jgi:uncharacterized protein YbjT (DUF2867 family)